MMQAHALAEAGASLILGHHPHVIQGLEQHGGVPIVYSLGNCVACDVLFTDGDRLTWNRTERTGGLLQADLSAGGVSNVRVQATYDDGRVVALETSGFGAHRLAHANRALARGVTMGRYHREYFWVKTMLPVLGHLKWSKLKRLRPTQVRKFLKGVSQAFRAR
jgi:poly-gamma-glutamate synthesis protein (capsule biosynthesis protein)